MINLSNVIRNYNNVLMNKEVKDKPEKTTIKPVPNIQEEFKLLIPDYELGAFIGEGSYGMVIKAKHKKTNRLVAIKKFLKLYQDEIDTLRVLREVSILRQLDHPNIVKLLDIIIPDRSSVDPVFIVLEYVETDLKSIIYGFNPPYLKDYQIAKLLIDILSGLDYLAARGIIHRDLKPSNILINTSKCEAKICDFGLARDMTVDYPCDSLLELFYELNPDYGEKIKTLVDEGVDSEVFLTFLNKNLEILSEKLFQNYNKELHGDKVANRLIIKTDENNSFIDHFKTLTLSDNKENFNLNENVDCKVLSELADFKPNWKMTDLKKLLDNVKPGNLLTALKNDKNYYPVYEEMKRLDSKLRKELTHHISTRWYRAPEVILLEEIYTNAIDVWAVGCIFGEMLQKLEGNSIRGPMFPGSYCHPISPMVNKDKDNKAVQSLSYDDQMKRIIEVLGTPSNNDLAFITNILAYDYIKRYQDYDPIDLSLIYPACSEEAMNLLKSMLRFNPTERVTINEALESPFLRKVRDNMWSYDKLYTMKHYPKKDDIIVNNYDKSGYLPDVPELRKLFLQEYYKFKLK
jgi:serine/threonine protein kinase